MTEGGSAIGRRILLAASLSLLVFSLAGFAWFHFRFRNRISAGMTSNSLPYDSNDEESLRKLVKDVKRLLEEKDI